MKTTFLKLLFILFFIGSLKTVQAQISNSFSDVLTIKLENMGPIYENNVVKGYYMFYDVDKADRKNRSYLIKILDENVREVASTIVTKSKDYVLQEALFNGEAILFVFIEPKKGFVELISMNKNAEVIGERIIENLNKWDNYYAGLAKAYKNSQNPMPVQNPGMTHLMGVESSSNGTFFSVKNRGFAKVRSFREDGKYRYEIQYYPNELGDEKGWKNLPGSKTPMNHMANLLNVSPNFAFLSTLRKKSMFTGDLSSTVKMVNLQNGNTVFEKTLSDKRYRLSLLNCFFNEEKEETLILGRYFNKDDAIFQGNSIIKGNMSLGLGIYAIRINRSGEVINKKFVSWREDLQNFIDLNAKGNVKDKNRSFLFHDSVIFPDGRFFLIAEASDYMGILMGTLGYDPMFSSNANPDFYVFEFEPDFTLADVYIWDIGQKEQREEANNSNRNNKENLNYFSYKFTEQSVDKKSFFTSYIGVEKNKGEKAKAFMGVIAVAADGISEDKIPLITEASKINILPAKPGYILLVEYFEKAKKLDMRLEKFNY